MIASRTCMRPVGIAIYSIDNAIEVRTARFWQHYPRAVQPAH